MRRLLGRAALIATVVVGTMVAVRYGADKSWAVAQTVMFTSVVFSQAIYAFAVRLPDHAAPVIEADGRTGFRRWVPGPSPWSNPRLVAAVAISLSLQVLVVQWPAAQSIFHTVGLDAGLWLLIAVTGVIPALALAAMHVARGAKARRRGPASEVSRQDDSHA